MDVCVCMCVCMHAHAYVSSDVLVNVKNWLPKEKIALIFSVADFHCITTPNVDDFNLPI